ncbi:hypothetical protein fHeYen901_142 [Yersinia phage fHe-Yen9-01]|uniref:Uncharacterized protein n=1 Tax=Yersinia phage fHe-Yen9-01 TaxID=1965363 RepID=A0A1V0DXP2_9CAUD|nr:hypothetical protein KNT60_gp141 [Yersinia phage fHe-Yen9-01]ARB05915.1 hypothetical protein fHeYen901_142 [Yersinia phage fHe-Yen9-01]
MLLVIGSRALYNAGLISINDVKNSDWDFIADEPDWIDFKSKMFGIEVKVANPNVSAFVCMHGGKETHFESYIVKEGHNEDSNALLLNYAEGNCRLDRLTGFKWATPEMCLAIKLSHRYKKNNPFFEKTQHHIRFLRNKDIRLTSYLEDIVKLRQKETLSYAHPVLDVTKDAFFKDDIYTYDHDTIHEAIALTDKPAYKYYMKDDSQVMTSKEKFMALPKEIQLAGVYEEACVLALERSQIPNNFKPGSELSFKMALEKVCTSITSGWFREFAWENYFVVMAMYKKLGPNDYVKRFKLNFDKVKPFTRGEQ